MFSSESVNEGHPDKLADQVSDAVLDECLKADPYSKVGDPFCSCDSAIPETARVSSCLMPTRRDCRSSLIPPRACGPDAHGVPEAARATHLDADMTPFDLHANTIAPFAQVACETATKDNMVMVFGEITTEAPLDYEKIVRNEVKKIGFDSFVDDLASVDSKGLSCDSCEVRRLMRRCPLYTCLSLTRPLTNPRPY